MKKKELTFKLPIQFFGEGGEGTEGSGTGGTEGTSGTGTEGTSFDDVLASNKEYQSEFDKRVSKALETHSEKLSAEYDKKINDAIEEQKRLAGLDEETKAKELELAKQKEFEEREAKLARRELETDVKDLLNEAGLSKEFLDFVVATDVDSSKQRIEALNGLINAQVEKCVQAKITGSGTPGATNTNIDDAVRDVFVKKY